MDSIYSLLLQKKFYEAIKIQRVLRYDQIVFQKFIPYPYNYMDIISDDKQVNQLITAYKELKDTGINKLIVNYEWTGHAENVLGE
jgi:hypothetical protein